MQGAVCKRETVSAPRHLQSTQDSRVTSKQAALEFLCVVPAVKGHNTAWIQNTFEVRRRALG